MRARRGVAEIYVGRDAGSLAVTFAQMRGKRLCLGVLDQVHGAAAESSAGEARADAAASLRPDRRECRPPGSWLRSRRDSWRGLHTSAAQGLEITGFEGVGCGDGALVLGNDVAAALENLGPHLVAPLLEVVDRGIAQQLDLRTMTSQQLVCLPPLRSGGCCIRLRRGNASPWCWRSRCSDAKVWARGGTQGSGNRAAKRDLRRRNKR